MSDKNICPLCGIENHSFDSKCSKCGYDLKRDNKDQKQATDWLNDLRSTSNEEDKLETINELIEDNSNQYDNSADSPDWLTRIRDRKEVDEEYSKFNEQIIEQVDKNNEINNTKDIIEDFRNQSEKRQNQNGESDNLISNLRDKTDNNFFTSNDPPGSIDPKLDSDSILSSNDQKEWFERLSLVKNSDKESDENEKTNDEVKEESVDIPGWIQNSNVIQSIDNIPDNEINIEKTKEEIPDWVSKFDSFETSDEKSEDEPVIPDWVQSTSLNSDEIGSEELESVDEIPDWIALDRGISFNESDEINGTQSPKEGLIEHERIQEFEIFETGPIIDLESEKPSIVTDVEATGNESENDGFELSDISLKELPINPATSKSKDQKRQKVQNQKPLTENNRFNLDSMPSWISETGTKDDDINSQASDQKENQPIQLENEISPGELPNWLKAMRPIESVTPNINLINNRKRIEKSGPLSGLSGVLTSEDVTKSYSSPPSYSVKLNLSEKQKINAEVLDQVFTIDQNPESALVKLPRNRELLFRIIITFILVATLIYTFISDNQKSGVTKIFPSESVRFTTISNGLLLNQETPPHILIIMDNEAASQAEINLLTRPVFERLMVKNSYLSIISTNPNGVLVAMETINKANSSVPSFNFEERISNFGYLPGSANGIHSFLSNPRISLPEGIFPKDIWNSPGLMEIQQISQFNSILMVSDNPESTKLWLEQIRIFIPDMTILVAATAQASPLLQPYVDSGQIDGMISGLYGSLTYSQLIQSESEILSPYWNMYKTGIYIFTFVIIIGGLIQVTNLILKKSVSKERY